MSAKGPVAAAHLWLVLARCYRAVSQVAEGSINESALGLTDFAVLEALYHKGPLLLGEVQKKILVSSGGVTYLVDRLVDRGLVRRKLCTEDRRARYAELTEEGTELMDRIFPEHAVCLAEVMSSLNGLEIREVTRMLRELGVHAASTPA